MSREEGTERHECVDVVLGRLAYAGGPLPLRHFHQPVGVLPTEAQPEPGVNEGRIGGGHEGVLLLEALFEPAGRGVSPYVAQQLGVAHRVPRRLDPDVRPPVLG